MDYVIGRYKIKPSPSKLDWEVFELRTIVSNKGEHAGESREDWASLGLYPASFGRALEVVWERMLKDGEGEAEGVAEVTRRILRVQEELRRVVGPDDERRGLLGRPVGRGRVSENGS